MLWRLAEEEEEERRHREPGRRLLAPWSRQGTCIRGGRGQAPEVDMGRGGLGAQRLRMERTKQEEEKELPVAVVRARTEREHDVARMGWMQASCSAAAASMRV